MAYKLPLEKIQRKEKFTLQETVEWLEQFGFKDYEIIGDSVGLLGDLKYSLSTKYFPLKISQVRGNLTLNNVGLPNDLSGLPRIIYGDLILTGNLFQKPFNFPTFTGSIDLSSNKNLNDITSLTQKDIKGDLTAINCNFTVFKNETIAHVHGSVNLSNNKINTVSFKALIQKDFVLSHNYMTGNPEISVLGELFLDSNPVHPDDQLESSMWG